MRDTLCKGNASYKIWFEWYSSLLLKNKNIKREFSEGVKKLVKEGVEEFGLLEEDSESSEVKNFYRTLLMLA